MLDKETIAVAEDDLKLLSAKVPTEIYWAFKKVAAIRKENIREALMNAALLYINVTGGEK